MVTKAAIAESILNLTRLEEGYRTQENCVRTPTLWLALASLCVLDKDHVEKYATDKALLFCPEMGSKNIHFIFADFHRANGRRDPSHGRCARTTTMA